MRPGVPRRTFLKIAGAGAVAASSRAAGQASAEVVVVGAGAFGGWTALCLRELGASVTLLDAYGPGNSRASSGGETRQIRAGYEDRELYTRWVLLAFERWRAREREWGRKLLFETGRLLLAPQWSDSLKVTKAVLDKFGVPNETLSHDELRRRYPQMNPEGVGVALFEPTTGVLMAREGCRAVAEAFQKKGGRFRIARAVPGKASGSRLADVALSDGSSLAASTFVFACGPWLPKVFPDLMKRKLFTPRRDVFFFGTPQGDDRFSYPNLPNFSEDASQGYYGFPSIDGRGFKVCPVGELTAFDPDTDERLVSPYQAKRARDYLALRFPALRDQPLVETRVCQLEMSVDEHFIIQRHPAFENVWLVGGGSGHGYKHGPVVGEYVAERVLGRDRQPELEQVFSLKSNTF
ncbi:MAG TPA: FAD-dependent oxidoreductase [Vicinamibacteria bacterium]|nr:FAD-dependent oxidoreductase [Vicinamibacteria bacterium]